MSMRGPRPNVADRADLLARARGRRELLRSGGSRADQEMVGEAMVVPRTEPPLQAWRERRVERADDRKSVRPAEVAVAIQGLDPETVVADELHDLDEGVHRVDR